MTAFSAAKYAGPPTPFELKCQKLAQSHRPDAERLTELQKSYWDYLMHETPEFATELGYPGAAAGSWSDDSLDAIHRREREISAPLKVLATIHAKKLGAKDQDNYELLKYHFTMQQEGLPFPGHLLALNQMGGAPLRAAEFLNQMPTAKVKDFENRLERLRGLPRVLQQTTDLLKEGLKEGIVEPKVIMQKLPAQLDLFASADPTKNPLLVSFKEMPITFSQADRDRILKEARSILVDIDVPAYVGLKEFITQSYIPKCRDTIGYKDLPNGEAWYNHRVKRSTTTDLRPSEIHAKGLAEIQRIHSEYDEVMKQTGFKGTLPEFLLYLRTDRKFFFTTGPEIIKDARDIAKRIDPELSRLFGLLPRLTYGVRPTPEYMEKSQAAAYYESGSVLTGRPGWFYLNTSMPDKTTRWDMESTILHEAVPGHHLQISLAMENGELPEFRKHGEYTAYVEGWALYAESLGKELGMYKDPYAYAGRLSDEAMRAVRLSVDTGLHSMGWSREQAIKFFIDNTGKHESFATSEVDRYIAWPSQALSYKIGELKIKELRARAEAKLGAAFDIRKFHDLVLKGGAVPLSFLDVTVDRWIQTTLGAQGKNTGG